MSRKLPPSASSDAFSGSKGNSAGSDSPASWLTAWRSRRGDRKAFEVAWAWVGDDVEIVGGSREAVCTDGEAADHDVVDSRSCERVDQVKRVEHRAPARRPHEARRQPDSDAPSLRGAR